MQTTYLIAAGGTAGHVVPALAVADALRTSGARVVFIGGDRAEAELVPRAGFEFRRIEVEGLDRSNPLRALRALAKSVTATFTAWKMIGKMRPAAVLGGGGYVAGPVGAAAVLRRVPLVLTEADSHFGLTNRLLAPFASKVCLAFHLDGRVGDRYIVTGRPIPLQAHDPSEARKRFGLSDGDRVIVVVGGSLGARSINEAALEAFAEDPQLKVIHAAGERDLASLEARPRGSGYQLFGYIDSFSEALLAADLVVSRAGGSVFEIAAAGRPAILVPYPHAAADHQAGNARWMEQAGAAIVLADDQLSGERLASEVGRLLADPEQLAQMANASASIARPDATAAVEAALRAAGAGR
jgi:UDP-N-acetylglucosamine--N-acetylmuramyl-(pentapeptide) pyrophosphoryl-undecaprenol N-acetylglucosamine transferase